MRRFHPVLPLLAILLVLLTGCGNRPKLVTVTGKVLHKGQGLTAGSIYFHPTKDNPYQGEKPSSLLQLDGSFTMKTYPYGEGVPPGTYKVTFAPELANRLGKPALANPDQSPFSIDVPDKGLSDQIFEVK